MTTELKVKKNKSTKINKSALDVNDKIVLVDVPETHKDLKKNFTGGSGNNNDTNKEKKIYKIVNSKDNEEDKTEKVKKTKSSKKTETIEDDTKEVKKTKGSKKTEIIEDDTKEIKKTKSSKETNNNVEKKIHTTRTSKKSNVDDSDEDSDEEVNNVKDKTIKRTRKVKKEDDNSLNPIIKWSGGKKDEIKMFEKHIPTNYDTYLEPFIGGGSVFFNQVPNKAVISDVHKELIDFYQAIKDGKAKEIYKFMQENPNDEETYYKVRDDMEIKTPLDNAKRFYYLRKTCFRGMMRYNKSGKFNIPWGKYKSINFEELLNDEYQKLLANTQIFNKSYEYVFKNFNSDKNFMFLDQPYDSEFTDYGYCKFDREEQEKLAKCFKETKIKCLMIVGKTDFISNLYKDYIVDEYDKKYRFKLYAGRVGDEINTKHLIIKNYKD